MRILSPDPINELKNNHTGLYVLGVCIGVIIFFLIFITFGLLKLLIIFLIKHYYVALVVLFLWMFLKIRKRDKIAKAKMQQLQQYGNSY